MKSHFINNLIPTLRKFALKIEFKSAIVGKVWVFPDDSSIIHDYEFTSDGKLYMSINGNIQIGKWEILPTGRIVIDRLVDKIMLNYDFALDGIIVMKKTEIGSLPFILYDRSVIPDGNLLSYIENNIKKSKEIGSNIDHGASALDEWESTKLPVIIFGVLAVIVFFMIISKI